MKLRIRRPLRTIFTSAVTAGAACALLIGGVAPANAQTISGWVGPWTANGINYLHYSTIQDTPDLSASSRIYTVDGNTVPTGIIGARARLFKSGALCQATNYKYNTSSSTQVVASTTGNCGTGSYNSHGFVQAWNGSGYSEVFTFPTNPLNYTVPGARAAGTAPEIRTGENANGQSIGSAEGVASDADLPELVAAYGTNNEFGFVYSDALTEQLPESPAVASDGGSRTIPLYDEGGKNQIGQFVVN